MEYQKITSLLGNIPDKVPRFIKHTAPNIHNIPLIHCELNLIFKWSKNCILTDMITTAAQGNNPAIAALTGTTFAITDCKLYVPVVTLSAENHNKLLEQLKAGFKRTIKWNKYRLEMSNQAKNNNLNYLIDPAFTKANRLSYHKKMKKIGLLFQSIMYQVLK